MTMKKIDRETITRETRDTPLAELYLHPLNPRQSVSDEDTEAMALSLETLGVMQNLLGIEDPEKDGSGKIGIVAGGRRLRGLQRMAANRGFDPAGLMVPVRFAKDRIEAQIWAGAENTARTALHPADEITAYARMIDDGGTVRLVAKAFAVTERHVQGRLKLAGLAGPVMTALKGGEITLDQAGALAICDDHAQQVSLLPRVIDWDQSPSEIRRALTREATEMGTGLARFISRAEYEAAGGAVREDLFGTDVYYEDGALLAKLAQAKLETIAAEVKAEGWRWVEVIPTTIDYETLTGYARTYPEQASITETEEAEYSELADLVETGDANEEQVARFETIEARLSEEQYSEVQYKIAGAVIGFDYHHDVRIERGLVIKADREAALTLGVIAPQPKTSKPVSSCPYSAALTRDLTAIRTAAVQKALLDQSGLTLDLLAFALHEGGGDHLHLGITAETARNRPEVEDGFIPDDRLEPCPHRLADPKATAHRFAAFQKRPQAERTALLTEAIARSLGGSLAGETALPFFEHIAGLTAASVRTVWTPTEAAFFKRLTSAQLDTLWCELLGKKTADNFYRKKADKTAFLHRLFNDAEFLSQYDQAIQNRVAAWMPEGMAITPIEKPRRKTEATKQKAKSRKPKTVTPVTEVA